MVAIIIGNILALVAVVFNYMNGTRKTKRDMIMCDIGAAGSYALSDLFLKGYSGVVQNFVGLLRNITVLYLPNDKYIGKILVVCGIVFGFYFNNRGFIGILPIITALIYSLCVISKTVDALTLKLAFILNTFAFLLYSFVLLNIVGVISNTVIIISSARSYLQLKKDHSK